MNALEQIKKRPLVQLFFALHSNESTPTVVVDTETGVYEVELPSGTTWLVNSDGSRVALSGCPIPGDLFFLGACFWAVKNRDVVYKSILATLCLVAGQYCLWLYPDSPMWEARDSFVAMFTDWGLFVLWVLVGLLVIAWAMLLVVQVLVEARDRKVEEPTTTELEELENLFFPDMAVLSVSPLESQEQFADRWRQAEADRTLGIWLIVIPYRTNAGTIVKDHGSSDFVVTGFARTFPPYERQDWPESEKTCLTNPMWETWDQYKTYVRRFAAHYCAWRDSAKLKNCADEGLHPNSVLQSAMSRKKRRTARAANVVALLLLSLASFAQAPTKTAEVSAYLKGSANYVPQAGQVVRYKFAEGVVTRRADGRSTLLQLLPQNSSFTDKGSGGGVEFVAIDGRQILPSGLAVSQRQSAATGSTPDPVRPKPLFDEDTSGLRQSSGHHLPDSAEAARMVEDMKRSVRPFFGAAWKTIQPVWRGVMWVFDSLSAFLLCLGGILRYIAQTSRQESRFSRGGKAVFNGGIGRTGQGAAALLLILCWVVIGVMLIQTFLWLVYLDLPLWLMLLIWAPILWSAEKITGRIVPNVNVDPGVGGNSVVKYNND